MPPSTPDDPEPASKERWWALVTVMIGTIASIMSSTIVNVAVPAMRRYLPLTAPGGVVASRQPNRFDWIGLILMSAALLALLNGLVGLHVAGPGGVPLSAIGLLAAAVICALGLVVHQHRAPKPGAGNAAAPLPAFHESFGVHAVVTAAAIFAAHRMKMTDKAAGAAPVDDLR